MHSGIAYPPSNEPQGSPAGAETQATEVPYEADACVKAGIDAPIIPGILPINNWTRIRRFATACGAVIPAWLDEAYTAAIRDGRESLLSTAVCSELCSDLIEGGVTDLHFYTLNTPELTREVCAALGVTPKLALAEVA